MNRNVPFETFSAVPQRAARRVVGGGACLLSLFGGVLGCSEDDGWVETRHARIRGEHGVCAGLAAYVDERIELTAGWFELEPGPKIDVSFGRSYVDEQQGNYDYRIGGVAYSRDGHVSVFSDTRSLGHELAHGVRFSNGLVLPKLIDEGVAQLYDGGEFDNSGGGISYAIPEDATLPDDPHSADVGVAATFVGWLHETLPREDFLRLINDPELNRDQDAASNWARIEQATGMSKETLEERWRTEAQFYYTEVPRCRPERTYNLQVGDVLRLDDTVSCSHSPTTFGPYLERDEVVYTTQRWHCLRLDETVSVRVTAMGPAGTEYGLSSVFDSCLTTSPFNEAASPKWVEFGETAEFTLGDCSWVTILRSDPEAVGEVSITIEVVE